jgi:hypothetical protein
MEYIRTTDNEEEMVLDIRDDIIASRVYHG